MVTAKRQFFKGESYAVKVNHVGEDGVDDFIHEEAVFAAMLARNVSLENIVRCFGSTTTSLGQVHIALALAPALARALALSLRL